jgi:predicted alpha/beta-fold hydrolase
LQTLWPALHGGPRADWRRERWDTPDSDFIDVDFAGDPEAARTLVLFHGLEGSSASHYARALARESLQQGWRLVLPHFRGCSGSPNRLPRAYHSGDSAEIDWVLKRVHASLSGGRALHAVGVSLGGNALLKWLGERESDALRVLRSAVAVSAPFDLAAAGAVLDRGVNQWLYTRHFLVTMKRKALAKLGDFPGLYDAARVRQARTLRAFDDIVTAPLHGFRDTDDYWARASSAAWLPGIRVPTLMLNARNDPFFPAVSLDRVTQPPPDLLLEFPHAGGHAGFPDAPFPGGPAWLPRRIFNFLSRV